MKVLVTGGAGFIGANFVQQTVREHPEHDVTVLDALTYAGDRSSLAPVADSITFVEGSITDTTLVDGVRKPATWRKVPAKFLSCACGQNFEIWLASVWP